MGTKGVRGKGWLRKVGEKQYQLTSTGLSSGEALMGRLSNAGQKKETKFLRAELDRQTSTALTRIVVTSAARKAFAKQNDLITFGDACGFWDITVRSNANTLTVRLTEMTVMLDRALNAVSGATTSEGLKIGNIMLSRYQIERLVSLHRDMQNLFKTELDFIRKRTDERVDKKARPF
jgi:hypothetical protein